MSFRHAGPMIVIAGLALAGAGWFLRADSNRAGIPKSNGSNTSGLVLANMRVLSKNAGRLSWSRTNDLIAYDQMDANGYYQLWIRRLDGSEKTCLSCAASELPGLNTGNPIWSPDGKFIVFQAAKGPSQGRQKDARHFPGSGWNMDLWATDTKGHFWQLTNVKFGYGGVIYPTFSWDGKKLAWGQRLSPFPLIFGSWELAVADWDVGANGAPLIRNIKYYTPGAVHHYYEPHAFSLDNQTLFFMGNLEPGQGRLAMDIYSFDLASGKLANLTKTQNQWNEFPEPMPNGKKLVYMSTVGNAKTASAVRCDLWSMNYDGSDKTRLTFYNDPSSPSYIPSGVCLCDPRWNADGTKLAVFNNQLAAHRREVTLNGESRGEMWLFDVQTR